MSFFYGYTKLNVKNSTSIKSTSSQSNYQPHIIVIGSGPIGMRFVEELRSRRPDSRITLFGDEKTKPYNREKLSLLLAGKISIDEIELTLPPESEQFSYKQLKIESIDASSKQVIDSHGDYYNFDKLVLATGARPHIPNIGGVDQRGVYSFHNLRDAESLYARNSRAKHIVVVGGGLLGIEAAKSLLKNNTKVTIIQQGVHLMNKQLDEKAAQILASKISTMGIRVITNMGVRHIKGDGRVTGVILRSRELIECDTVLFCSGISPNMEIARSARLRVNRGIVVNQQMQTSNASVFAIGECCEHEDVTYGIVNPGYEQAAVLAQVISGMQVNYKGSLQSTSLKVIDFPVRSFGQAVNYQRTPFHREVIFENDFAYRKLVFFRGGLVGGIGVGDWSEYLAIFELFKQNGDITFYQRWLFKFKGCVFFRSFRKEIDEWASNICNFRQCH